MLPILPSEKTSQNLVRNLVGYSIMGLTTALITMFTMYQNLNAYIRKDLQNGNTEMRVILDKNNTILYQVQLTFKSQNEEQRIKSWETGQLAAMRFIDSVDLQSKREYKVK